MKTIYRYKLEEKNVNVVKLPHGAHVLKIDYATPNDEDLRELSVWAIVDTENLDYTDERKFVIFPTGADMSEMFGRGGYNPKYICSYRKYDNYEFHAFEVEND